MTGKMGRAPNFSGTSGPKKGAKFLTPAGAKARKARLIKGRRRHWQAIWRGAMGKPFQKGFRKRATEISQKDYQKTSGRDEDRLPDQIFWWR